MPFHRYLANFCVIDAEFSVIDWLKSASGVALISCVF